MNTTLSTEIRQVLSASVGLDAGAGLDEHADLFSAGMSSHQSITLMLALEDTFDVEFPDAMLTRSVFSSIASIAEALSQLTLEAAA